jgi:sporulation protein YlmC with PRC-barrel domain
VVLLTATALVAADTAPKATDGNKVQAVKTFRSSTLVGMEVRNLHNEKLGTIDDLVIDVEKGRVAYAALGVGGLLGLGEKLFAIPWAALQQSAGLGTLTLYVDKETLQAASGFDKEQWPTTAETRWGGTKTP